MSMSRPSFLALAASSVFLAACGGGGALGSSVSLSAAPKAVAYGSAVAVRWSASSSASFGASNFGVGPSGFRGGSLSDTPGTDTTYRLKVYKADSSPVTATATVRVAKISKAVLVVGDAAAPGPAQMRGFAQGLTTGAVETSSTVPSPSEAYGLLFLSPTAAITDATVRDRVKAWLDAGKGVVLCGRAPSLLATGNASNTNVSSIGSWFFGVGTLYLNLGLGLADTVRSAPEGLVRLSATIRGGDDDSTDIAGYISGFGPQVDGVAAKVLCAYQPPSGGRLVYSGSPVGFGNKAGGTFQQAFESAFRWAGQ